MAVFGTDRRVLVLAFARMADEMGNSFLIIVLPLYIASGQIQLDALLGTQVPILSITVTESLLIGLALSMFGFLNSFSQPFTGRLTDRAGRRKVFILFGLAILGIGSGGYLFVSQYRWVLFFRLLQGIGAAFTIPATVALVNEFATSARTRGGNFGVYNTFRLIGFGFGPIVAGVVVEFWGFDAAFLVAVAGAFFSFLLVYLFVEDPEETQASAGSDLSIAVRGPPGYLLDPVFTLGLGTVAMGIAIALFAPLEGQINARLGQSSVLFGVQFGAVTIANILLQIPIGRASDGYGRRPFLVAGFLILVPSTLAQGYVLSPLMMTLARLAQGVAVAMVFAPSLALAGDLAREGASGTTLSVLTMAFGFGVAVGPLSAGFLERFGFHVPFLAGSVLAVLALLLVYTQVEETLTDTKSIFGS
ncbi:MFS transporter [Halodesulfurarchaeum sp. HSR-GB]|uniref:MFS transporter n=1 Tax=Halodesulfurarchaeum sp. HSR-GB TaxID=3074077 RepID=UPI002863A67D|nr:MFS transporter [Halodesulfurarchaeum sp. HSR-GB]MDR5656907.1 MFS transporter [Halodesulfurarchaeum sp. HSR-GB]